MKMNGILISVKIEKVRTSTLFLIRILMKNARNKIMINIKRFSRIKSKTISIAQRSPLKKVK